METKQIGIYLMIAGAVILALKFINAIIGFIMSDFLLGLGTILIIVTRNSICSRRSLFF